MNYIEDLESRASKLESQLGSPFELGNIFNFEMTLSEDETEKFPVAKIRELNRLKISEWILLKKYGGLLEHYDQLIEITKAIARRDMTTQIALGKNFLGSLPVFLFGSDEQIQSVMSSIRKSGFVSLGVTEKTNGSDLFKTQMNSCSTDQGAMMINGEKWLINNITHCEYIVLLSKIGNSDGPRAFNLLLIEPKQLQSGYVREGEKIPTFGVRGMKMGSLVFHDAKFSGPLRLGKEGQGIDQTLKTFQVSKGVCAGLGIGAVETSLRLVTEFVLKRNLYSQTLDQLPVIQYRLASIYTRLQMIEMIYYFQSRSISFFPENLSIWSAFVKYFVPTECEQMMHELAQVLGARYFIRGSFYSGFFQKSLRDIALVPLFDGSTQVNLYIIANQLAQIVMDQPPSGEVLDRLVECFNIGSKPPQLSFEKLRLTNRGADPLLSSGKYIRSIVPTEFQKVIESFSSAFTLDVKKIKQENIENFDPIKFNLAKRYCLLQAIQCILWNQKSELKVSEAVFKMSLASCIEKINPYSSWGGDYRLVFDELINKVTQDKNLGLLNYQVAPFYKAKKDYDFV